MIPVLLFYTTQRYSWRSSKKYPAMLAPGYKKSPLRIPLKLHTLTTFRSISRGLMKNMLLAYFNTSEQKRSEVVAVLGHILNFSEDEIRNVGTGSHPPHATGWFSGLLSYSGSSQSQQQHDKVHVFIVERLC